MPSNMCAPLTTQYWASGEEGDGGHMTHLSILLGGPRQLYYPLGCFANWGGEKATSDLWGMSISSTTQAAPSWVDLGNVFNVASRISECFTEWIYSSCRSQDSFNSKHEFYLFHGTCQVSCVIRKEACTEVSHKCMYRSSPPRLSAVIQLAPKPVTRTQSTTLTCCSIILLASSSPT